MLWTMAPNRGDSSLPGQMSFCSWVDCMHKEQRAQKTHLPQVWPPIHQVKDLGRVEELLELAQEFDSLVVPTLRVDKGQQRAGTGGGAGGLPEPWQNGQTIQSANSRTGMDAHLVDWLFVPTEP